MFKIGVAIAMAGAAAGCADELEPLPPEVEIVAQPVSVDAERPENQCAQPFDGAWTFELRRANTDMPLLRSASGNGNGLVDGSRFECLKSELGSSWQVECLEDHSFEGYPPNEIEVLIDGDLGGGMASARIFECETTYDISSVTALE